MSSHLETRNLWHFKVQKRHFVPSYIFIMYVRIFGKGTRYPGKIADQEQGIMVIIADQEHGTMVKLQIRNTVSR